MGAQSILSHTDLCSRINDYLVCQSEQYLRYDCYKIGESPNLEELDKVVSMRDLICLGMCDLTEDEIQLLSEKVNAIVT